MRRAAAAAVLLAVAAAGCGGSDRSTLELGAVAVSGGSTAGFEARVMRGRETVARGWGEFRVDPGRYRVVVTGPARCSLALEVGERQLASAQVVTVGGRRCTILTGSTD